MLRVTAPPDLPSDDRLRPTNHLPQTGGPPRPTNNPPQAKAERGSICIRSGAESADQVSFLTLIQSCTDLIRTEPQSRGSLSADYGSIRG